MPPPTRRARNWAGRRACPIWIPSCRPHGTGIARILMATTGEPRGLVTGQSPLRRLFRYARPYKGRLSWAVAGMLVYAAASAGLAALIKPIFDDVLRYQQHLTLIAWTIVALYLL